MILNFKNGWSILQDVHDAGEKLGMYQPGFQGNMGNQVSEWEYIPELKHLQLLYASQPYFGRELRYFNQAPWWYRLEFDIEANAGRYAKLSFTNVDYYCKVWLNGKYLGEHEGYSTPFSFRVDGVLVRGGKNTLIVKVWSPWDDAVDGGREDRRTFLVYRNSIKGTYEHSDTFVQRDANPVGIYGDVTLEICSNACFGEIPEFDYSLDAEMTTAHITAKAAVEDVDGGEYVLRFICRDRLTGEHVCDSELPVNKTGEYALQADARNIRLWNTWDKGGPWLYTMRIELLRDSLVIASHEDAVGFRKIEMVRDSEKTRFYLNGRGFYVRGTSYFPDLYVSNMCRERYWRDLLNIKAAGFNLIRIHVHVDQPVFYELCTQLGIGVMQDSEYNWMHPVSDSFADRFIKVYLDTVKMLKRHSSMFCWICMNEPGLEDPMGKSSGRAMTVNPGPRLYNAVRELDPSRPAIKGSFCEDDLDSGDSHNYTGSLNGEHQHYSDIYATVEKFNTEYGFDAPPCLYSLKQCPPAMKRLSGIADCFAQIQIYQYKLLKYYTEHYRMQKYAPNSGYVQFLFNDMCPQSFYGLYDWWGLPKAGLDAMLQSNMPVGVFLKYNGKKAEAVFAVNDNPDALGEVEVRYVFTDETGTVVDSQTRTICMGADDIACIWKLDLKAEDYKILNCSLTITGNGKVLAVNHYEDLFNMPEHVKGHPSRISHELGMRLYFS
ncbi:MAG: glycoside hydrolase family 2 TIM barrel-domain containing protein [Clostridia bacterium]|nr:glycoside hydrolase family 2 TIM barrel-domain containing protein [Clostridia bacterium]